MDPDPDADRLGAGRVRAPIDRGPGHGKAKVYVDGVLIRTVDLNASLDAPRRMIFRRHWSTVGSHTVKIVVSGTGVVGLDAFVVLR